MDFGGSMEALAILVMGHTSWLMLMETRTWTGPPHMYMCAECNSASGSCQFAVDASSWDLCIAARTLGPLQPL